MTRNTGFTDRIIRFIIGAGLVLNWLFAWIAIPGVWTIVVGIVGLVLVVTAFMGFCPIYALFGINTNPDNEKQKT